MISPAIPINEAQRLESLRELEIIDSLPEDAYDSITQLASYICKTPIAVINIIDSDHNWFKSKFGTELGGSSREDSFCGHTILEPETFLEIPNASKDERFKDNPFVTSEARINYYAGISLLDHKGFPMGTLCVYDSKEHHLDKNQKIALKALGKQVEMLFESRRKNKALENLKLELDENNRILKEFASTVSHDLKMPLANMILTADMLKVKYANQLDSQGLEYINYLKDSGLTLSDYINGLLDHYSSNKAHSGVHEEFFLNDLLEDIIDLLQIAENCEINLPDNNLKIFGNSAALGQVFMNLISNSLKYNSNEKIIIEIDCTENREFFNFSISDNGIGIPLDKQNQIFDLFTTIAAKDRKGKKGHGIGLSTVKKLIESLGGNIHLTSDVDRGTLFEFSIKRQETVD
ncbi:GAF domain-containing sensor histidine kinase [Gramella sp. MAR_2010_147]|uniref:GAF domain-containing sensor histidine kinase n=1 Tax=Gramella sp. MAR_2010_147 TaxID=1250205 RepID=UPI00087A7E4C|nr:GAF domain-containing sensor histidine kinase [Gramella sp. MAR_2010_147]SDR83650.1 GAF sensor signal transduction histidine kinase [Gramella sp. MAR_2010_147]